MSGQPDPARREPLWSRVDRNRLTLAGYVFAFVVISVAVLDAYAVVFLGCAGMFVWARMGFGPQGLAAPLVILGVFSAVFAVVALAWAVFALMRSERWLIGRLGATLVPRGELMDTKYALKDMAVAAGLPVAPALYLIDSRSTNAFVFAARARRAVVGVTTGFVEKLTAEQQRAVFANLVARIVSGDTTVSTGVTALLQPLHKWRVSRRGLDEKMFVDTVPGEPSKSAKTADDMGLTYVVIVVFGIGLAILAELIAAAHRRSQFNVAEKADAEGMLLLKHPQAMLSALETCVERDNAVAVAGEELGELFYCWPGPSTNDDSDPEWGRVARLREVLGIEGLM